MLFCFVRNVLGPELYRIYKQPGQIRAGRDYRMNNYEYYSNSFISFFHGFCVLCKWTSPIWLAFAYNRGYLTVDGLYLICRLAFIFGGCLSTAYIFRGFGRYLNADYKLFINQYSELNRMSKEIAAQRREFLKRFDFEMSKWEANYVSTSKPVLFKNEPFRISFDSPINSFRLITWKILSHLCADTFGFRMMFPGTILHPFFAKALNDGRAKFIEKKRANRAVIQTADSHRNKIDTLFIDQRNLVRYNAANPSTLDDNNNTNSGDTNGNYLVICCEGNAGFYEVGSFQIPIDLGYSVLGWNYPGFAQSSGLPYPSQVTGAADAVMQYAFSLGFKEENVILFSWSIGGFAVSWLAAVYPEVKSVILDACFDDIVYLAQQQMPKFANASTNRGNDLLLKTLNSRYPHIVDEETEPIIRNYLNAQTEYERVSILSSYSENFNECELILARFVDLNSNRFPLNLGIENNEESIFSLSKTLKLSLAVYLAEKYMSHFESTHCTQLPKVYFKQPWSEQLLLLVNNS